MFDHLMADAFKDFEVPDFVESLYSVTPFPPADVYLDKDKNLVFELGISGYDQEDISIESTGDYLILSGEKKEKEEDKEEKKYLKRGLKRGKFIAKYFIPASKYSKDNIKATYKNGVLKIVVGVIADQQPKKVKIDI
jgi:HSP20 family protein